MGHDLKKRPLRGFGDTNFVLLARDAERILKGAAQLPEVAYTFDALGETETHWKVRHFTATEGLSTPYECVVDLATETLSANPDTLLGKSAMLQLYREPVARRFYGVIRRVEHRGAVADHRMARVFVVPALWALSQRSDARIFQDMTAVEVVQRVLREAGLYVGMLDVQLLREYPKREYCVQYRETDLAFVMRLLESEGVTFFFRHEEEGETLVLVDGAHAWETVRTMDGGPIPITTEVATLRVEAVRHLTWERETRPSGVEVRDFDFTRPDFKVERLAPWRRDGERVLYEPTPAVTMGSYQTPIYTRDDATEQTQLRFEAEQVDGAVGSGEGAVTGMIPGAMFGLTVAPQRYVITRVEHEGSAPDELLHGALGSAADEDRYHNRFRCVPVEVAYRPARRTARPTISGLQTATVVGPGGEEIYTDEHGRIRVQFHWDRQGARDEHSTCWMRVMQGPWAGNGWGFQFLPRVGMEVAVSFIEGDPDKPVVVGALYNGRNGVPFGLPAERTRSGIKTQSVGGSGHNELSFEDRAGAEQVYLHAQRDLAEVVERDHDTAVKRDQTLVVGRDQREQIEGRRAVTVTLDDARTVTGDSREIIQGTRLERVEGGSTSIVQGAHQALYERTLLQEVTLGETHRVGADRTIEVAGDHRSVTHGRQTVAVDGAQDTVLRAGGTLSSIGSYTVSTARSLAFHAADSIRLVCGDSVIEVNPDEILIRSRDVKVVAMETASTVVKGASLRLERDVAALHATREASVASGRVKVAGRGAEFELGDGVLRGAAQQTIELNAANASLRLEHVAVLEGTNVKLQTGSQGGRFEAPKPGEVRANWIDITLVRSHSRADAPDVFEERPVPGARYVVEAAGGKIYTGSLDGEGRARVMIPPGPARVHFPDYDGDAVTRK